MLFKDLLQLKYDENQKIDIFELKKFLIQTPEYILSNIYSDHGRNHDFQNLYNEVPIDSLTWNLIELEGSNIIGCTINPEFREYYEIKVSKALSVKKNDWEAIENTPNVIDSWERNNTWIEPPMFFSRSVFSTSASIHLVEGHSRVGTLRGLIEACIIQSKKKHKIWIAC